MIEELSQKVFEGLPDLASLHPRLNWVSPLEKDRFVEYPAHPLVLTSGQNQRL